ncbi:hypothetical protein [Clostridium sp.]|nr:hypothetical protein [Clostridium sp.]
MGKILVVDEDKNINKLIKSLLENENYEVIAALDVKESLERMV